MTSRGRFVAALAACALPLAACAGASDALESSSGVKLYCAQQQSGDAVAIAVSFLENNSSDDAVLSAPVLVDPTPGMVLEGFYLLEESGLDTLANGSEFVMPTDPSVTVPAHGTRLVVLGIGLDDSAPAARADGVEFRYRSGASEGTVRTETALQTTHSEMCDDGWSPSPGA
jgi:hypothetical protein